MFLEKIVQNRDVELSLDKVLGIQGDYSALCRYHLGKLEDTFPKTYEFLHLPKMYKERKIPIKLGLSKTH